MDEPTNDLDYETIIWLVDFLSNYENTIIVVSHDRHFLDSICTHISDIDYNKISHYSGNYTFWHESSQLALRQKSQQNKKAEDKKKELQEFISRFSANVSKSKQATSRKKMIDKLNIDEIKPSSRRYPGILFEQSREAGDQILNVNNLSYKLDNEVLFENISFNLKKGDKVIVHSKDSRASSIFFDVISNLKNQTSGSFELGITINLSYLPLDNSSFFNSDNNLIEWLRNFAKTDEEREELFLRSFLGKMVFSGEEALKKCKVLSGGEKVRCMISKIMMNRPNLIILDEPTSHLDLESITAFNNALKKYDGTLIISTHDHEFAQSLGNRVIELTANGTIDRYSKFDEYIRDPKIKLLRDQLNN
jgi:ATPase subunit of ABC transporter with duplicated ATPase domains